MHRRQSIVAGLLRADSDAECGFAERLRLAPEDGAARLPRERCAAFAKEPPSEERHGVQRLSSK